MGINFVVRVKKQPLLPLICQPNSNPLIPLIFFSLAKPSDYPAQINTDMPAGIAPNASEHSPSTSSVSSFASSSPPSSNSPLGSCSDSATSPPAKPSEPQHANHFQANTRHVNGHSPLVPDARER